MGKKIAILIVVLLVLGIGFYSYNKREAKAPEADTGLVQSQNQQPAQQPPAGSSSSTPVVPGKTIVKDNAGAADYSPGHFSTGDEAETSNIQVVEIDYNGTSFNPSSVDIHANDWVFFKNTGKTDFWPASNPHPLHTDYSGFDAKKAVAPGAQYKFQFTKIGSWGFHNHLNPSMHGTVNVTK